MRASPFPSHTKTLESVGNMELSATGVSRVPSGSELLPFQAILGTLELFQDAWALHGLDEPSVTVSLACAVYRTKGALLSQSHPTHILFSLVPHQLL